jgi:hypothetical protein
MVNIIYVRPEIVTAVKRKITLRLLEYDAPIIILEELATYVLQIRVKGKGRPCHGSGG